MTQSPRERALEAALQLAERNAKARLYMLPVKVAPIDRAALETELATYSAALALPSSPPDDAETAYWKAYRAGIDATPQDDAPALAVGEHTPGPWRLPVGVIGADRVWSADGETEICVSYGSDWRRVDADMRLIAAAPDMLAALDAAAEWLREVGVHVPGGRETLTICRAASARATGKEG